MTYDAERATSKNAGEPPLPFRPPGWLDAGVPRPQDADKATEPLLQPQRARRYPYLDATRIACVICVAIDHGAPQFGIWNVVFTQNWVLQLLFVTSGAAFAMSRQGICGYLARLLFYFALGVAINLTAWSLAGLDWRHNLFDVVFQFWFIAGLMVNSVLLYPLKSYLAKVHSDSVRAWGADDPDLLFGQLPAARAPTDLAVAAAAPQPEPEPWGLHAGAAGEAEAPRRDAEAPGESSRAPSNAYEALFKAIAFLALSIGAIVVVTMAVVEPALQRLVAPGVVRFFRSSAKGMGAGQEYWGLPTDPEAARAALHALCGYIQCSAGSVCIAVLFPLLHKRTSLVGWLVMLNMFLHRVILYRQPTERPFHGFDLFLLAFVVAHLGLRHRATVGTIVVRYWFVWVITCGLVWMPGTHERLDAVPPGDLPGRARVNFLEGFFIVAWLTAGEWFFDERIFSEDKLDFMNNWALAVFLLHKGIHILTKWPANWMLILALIPACWLWKRRKSLKNLA